MNMPRSEYPNPQFERKNWINLNGKWEFEIDNGKSGRERKLYESEKLNGEIIVPFCPESKLSGVENKDFMAAVWYRRIFSVPDEWKNGRVNLHFGAVDYEAFIYINGSLAGTHKGGYTSFFVDITKYIKDGENIVTVCAEDNNRGNMQPCGKQSREYYSHGCDYTRTTGIWQTVWLEHTPDEYIKNVRYYTDINNKAVQIQAEVAGRGIFSAKAFYEGKQVGEAKTESGGNTVFVTIALSEVHLWEVGCGRLYDIELTYGEDSVKSYFGMRNVNLDGMKFKINGKSVFQRLVLDQGFYPDGIYTAPDEADLIRDIQLSLDVGFNGARLHQKVFEPRFLYHCDKMGYIVWGEQGNWGLDYSNPAALEAFLPEWLEALQRDFNHPAIIGWCPFNETWDFEGRKQRDELLSIVYKTTKAFDITRPCIDTSGNYHVITDIFDVHDYEQNPEILKEHYNKLASDNEIYDIYSSRQKYNKQPTFVSEYGGICWNVEGREGWGYGQGPKTEEEFIARYKGLTEALLNNENMFGFCYTQLYDVEQELNGLYTYSRKPKFDCKIFHDINTRKAKIED